MQKFSKKNKLPSYIFNSQDPVIKLYDNIPDKLSNSLPNGSNNISKWITLYNPINFLTEIVFSDPDFHAVLNLWIPKVAAHIINNIDVNALKINNGIITTSGRQWRELTELLVDQYSGNYLCVIQGLSIAISILLQNQSQSYIDWLKMADYSICDLLNTTAEVLNPISLILSEPNAILDKYFKLSNNNATLDLPILPISTFLNSNNHENLNIERKFISTVGKIHLLSPITNVIMEGMFLCPKCKTFQKKSFFKNIYEVSLFQITQLLIESKTKQFSIQLKNIDPVLFSTMEVLKSTWKTNSKCDTTSCNSPITSMHIDWKDPETKIFSYRYIR